MQVVGRRRRDRRAVFSRVFESMALGRLHRWLALLMFLLFGPQIRANAAEYTLEQIKQGYRASIAALDPIWTRCELSQSYATQAPEFGWTNSKGDRVEWAVDGSSFHCSWYPSNTTLWFSSDGKRTWELDYGFAEREEDPRRVKCAQEQSLQTKTDSRLRNRVTPGRWLGLYISAGEKVQSGESVSTMLEKPSAIITGTDDVDGHQTVGVDLVYRLLNENETELPVHVSFDPEFGFLPRRILVDLAPIVPVTHEYLVEEFTVVKTPSSSSAFLPSQMTMRALHPESPAKDTSGTLILKEAHIGERLESSLFKPQLPDGVPTFNMNDRKERLARQDFLAGETPETKKARLDALRQKAASRPGPSALPAGLQPKMAAAPAGGWSWSITLVFVGGLLLALATWQFARR